MLPAGAIEMVDKRQAEMQFVECNRLIPLHSLIRSRFPSNQPLTASTVHKQDHSPVFGDCPEGNCT
jgi:hypothetical protein